MDKRFNLVFDGSVGERKSGNIEFPGAPEVLPDSEASDAGKHLVVGDDGQPTWENVPEELPAIAAGDAGKMLAVNSEGTAPEWKKVPEELPEFVVGDAGKHLAIKADGSGLEWVTPFALPTLPEDAATKTYALQAVNGVLTWVEVVEEAAE